MAKKIKRCRTSGIRLDKCFYNRDVDYIQTVFRTNTEQHREIKDCLTSIQMELSSISNVRLNGDGRVTKLSDILKELLDATKSIRTTNCFRKAFHEWQNGTNTGRFFKTWLGKVLEIILVLWFVLASLNTLGVKDINSVTIIFDIIKHKITTF